VLIAEELSPATVEALGPDFDVRYCSGSDRADLLASVPEANALLVRSATKVDSEVLAAGRHLQVVARAGVGLDNVDVRAATQAGVMVVNAPTSNITSAAELAIGLLLSAARHIPAAHSTLKQGEWKRSAFTGTELYDKTVGIVGLGRIGVLVAQRLSAFGMHVIAFDPYVQAGRAAQMGVRLVSLDELLSESDAISVHLPKTAETTGLIGDEQLHRVKPGVIVINAARGGIVDEQALHSALKEGRVRAAGTGRLRHRAMHRLAAVRARLRRRHPAPGREYRRGAGEGGSRRRSLGAPRAGRRAGPRCGQRPGWRDRRGRPARHRADREPRADLHRAG
jgi:D-3-phosphoglycerate dehydrogenase